MTCLIDQADGFIQEGAAIHTGDGHLALKAVTLAMGAKSALAAVIARRRCLVFMRTCQQWRDANREVGGVVVGDAIHKTLALFGQNTQLFRAIGQIIQKRLFGLPDRLTEFPGFNLDQAVFIGRCLLVGFHCSAQCDLMAWGHDGGWHS